MMISVELNSNASEKIHYNHSDYPMFIRRGLLSLYPNYTAPNHWHDDVELIAVLDGEMKYHVNGEILLLKKGEGIVINSGQMHFGFSDTRSECDFICVLLHPMLLCPIHSFERDYLQPVISQQGFAFALLRPGIEWQHQIYERILALYEHCSRKTAPLWILSEFSAIWALLYENLPKSTSNGMRQTRDLTILKNMVGFIQQSYPKKITLSDIAASGAVGQSKCCRLFASYFSLSPVAYLNQYRLNKSLSLLKETDLSILEIALSVGFGNASYYAETFRRWMGKSPSEFKKQLHKELPI